jgi:hypothetical protein
MDCSLGLELETVVRLLTATTAWSSRENTMNIGHFLVIAILLLLAWAGGFLMFHLASALIHLLLVVALLSLIFHFITLRRTV